MSARKHQYTAFAVASRVCVCVCVSCVVAPTFINDIMFDPCTKSTMPLAFQTMLTTTTSMKTAPAPDAEDAECDEGRQQKKKNQYYKPIKFSDVLYFEIYSYYIIVAGRCCHFILYGSTARTHTHPPEPANVVFSFTQLAFCVVFLTASSRWYLRLSGWRCVSIATEGIGSRYLFSSCVHRIFLADA